MSSSLHADSITRVQQQWRNECPALDTMPLGIIGRILRIAHVVEPSLRDLLKAHRLDRGSFDILATLRRTGPPYQLSPSALATELVLTSGAITQRLDVLQRESLINRTRSTTDGRSVLVSLTARGSKIVETTITEYMALQMKLLDSMNKTQKQELASLLTSLCNHLEGTI